jgi:hypothetical protein
LGTALLLLACLPLAACGKSSSPAKDERAAEAAEPQSEAEAAAAAGSAAPAGPTPTSATPSAPRAAVVFKKPPPDPPEVAVIRQRVIRGDRSVRTLKELQKLTFKYPKNADVAYILGQLYCTKLWISDCLQHFNRTLALDPTYRENPFLIRSVVAGLGNDSDHFKVRRFLVQQIGQPAQPYLEEVLQGTWRQQVKDRASATLREIK